MDVQIDAVAHENMYLDLQRRLELSNLAERAQLRHQRKADPHVGRSVTSAWTRIATKSIPEVPVAVL